MWFYYGPSLPLELDREKIEKSPKMKKLFHFLVLVIFFLLFVEINNDENSIRRLGLIINALPLSKLYIHHSTHSYFISSSFWNFYLKKKEYINLLK